MDERGVLRGKRIYVISSNLLDFWFSFVWKFYPDIFKREEAKRNFIANFNKFVGLKFEDMADKIVSLPFKPDRMGRWWGAYRDEDGIRRTAEIDLLALKEDSREIAFFEARWSRLTEGGARKIIEELEERSSQVKWHLGDRREYFGVVAKKVEGKEHLRDEGYLAFDLEDLG